MNASGVIVGAVVSPHGVGHSAEWVANKLHVLATGLNNDIAFGINQHGEVVGAGLDPATSNLVSYVYLNGKLTRLRGLGGGYDRARSIGDDGEIAGASVDRKGGILAVRWMNADARPEVLTPLHRFGGSFGYGINDRGVTVGFSGGGPNASPSAPFIATRWSASGARQALQSIGGPGALGQAFTVDAAGNAAGGSDNGSDYPDPKIATHATLWGPSGRPQDLGTFTGGMNSLAISLSPAGLVAGGSDAWDGASHAFVWKGHGPLMTLPVPGAAFTKSTSSAHGISDDGTVVGLSGPVPGTTYATVWKCAFHQAYVPRPPAGGHVVAPAAARLSASWTDS